MEGGVRVKGLSSLPGCMLLSLALSSPIKPATPQQYGAINYRHAAINAERRGEERQEHINRTNGHIKDIKPCSLPLSNTHKHSLSAPFTFLRCHSVSEWVWVCFKYRWERKKTAQCMHSWLFHDTEANLWKRLKTMWRFRLTVLTAVCFYCPRVTDKNPVTSTEPK